MHKLSIIALLFALGSCAPPKVVTPVTPVPPQSEVKQAQTPFPANVETEFDQGKALYEQHCGTCHALQPPSSQTADRWKEIVPNMSKMVNEQRPNALDQAKQDLILNYLITMIK